MNTSISDPYLSSLFRSHRSSNVMVFLVALKTVMSNQKKNIWLKKEERYSGDGLLT